MNIKLLAIDTSTHACSAALYINGDVIEQYHYAPRLHGELILKLIDELLKSARLDLNEIDALAYGAGPGSFTGVRMASSCVQGLAIGTNKPVIAISSLKAMAHTVYEQLGYKKLACAFDARMQEVYWGLYTFEQVWKLIGTETNVTPHEVPVLSEEWIGIGDGWGAYAKVLQDKTGIQEILPRAYPHASAIATLAVSQYLNRDYLEPTQALPTYCRNQVTK